jgi:hypothetical protein
MDPQRSEDIRHRGTSSRSEAIGHGMSETRSPDNGVRAEHGRVFSMRRCPDDGVRATLGKGAEQ